MGHHLLLTASLPSLPSGQRLGALRHFVEAYKSPKLPPCERRGLLEAMFFLFFPEKSEENQHDVFR